MKLNCKEKHEERRLKSRREAPPTQVTTMPAPTMIQP
jgi:hypothetical protein